MSSPRWAEDLVFYDDLSTKVRPALSPYAYYDEFLQGPQIFWVPDKIVFLRKWKSVDLVLIFFPTQMISNTLLSWNLREDQVELCQKLNH